MKLDILAIAAHPDDIELACAGTLLAHVRLGKKTGILDLTQGELGTRGNAALRLEEADKAAKIVGALIRDNLGFADGFFRNDKDHQLELIKRIRAYQPEIVLTNAIHDRHPDHGRAAVLVSEACFYSGLRKIETTYQEKQQEAWRPKVVYHFIQDRYIKPDFVVDISEFMELKMKAIKTFKSQFFDPDSNEPQTPISSMEFLNHVTQRATEMGRFIGTEYGEGFTVERYIGVKNLFDIF